MIRLTRRSFMIPTALATAAVLFAPRLTKPVMAEETTERLRRLFQNSEACKRLARRGDLWSRVGEPHSLEDCVGMPSRRIARMTDGMLLSTIKYSIRSDFSLGRIKVVDGWQISETELTILRRI